MHQNLVPDPFLIFVNNAKQPLHARNYFKNKIFWNRMAKRPKKVNFIVSPIPHNGKDYETQKGHETSDKTVLQVTKQVQKNSFIKNVIPD